MTYEILTKNDGVWHDILPLCEEGGIQFTLPALDGPNAGRTMDGVMHLDFVADKMNAEVKHIPLHTIVARALLEMLSQRPIRVRITHPRFGIYECDCYTNNIKTGVAYVSDDGYELWDGMSYTLIEM